MEQVQTILTSNRKWMQWNNKESENLKTKKSLIKSKWKSYWLVSEMKKQRQLNNLRKETNFKFEFEKRNLFLMIKRKHTSSKEHSWSKRRIKLRSYQHSLKNWLLSKKSLTLRRMLQKSQLRNSKLKTLILRDKLWWLYKRLRSTLFWKKLTLRI